MHARNPIHVVSSTAAKSDRHEALRALHQELAQAERHMQAILHAKPV